MNNVRGRNSEITPEIDVGRYKREHEEAQEQQAAAAEILKLISRSPYDLQTVLDTLTERAVQLCAANGGIISMQDGDMYRVRAVYGFSSDGKKYLLEHPLLPRNRGGITGRVALSGKAVHIPDVLADPEYTATGYQKALRQRTNLGVPLLRDGTTIGVFSLTRTKVDPFTDRQIELVATFADQAVIAIENTRLVNELRDSERQLREERERLIVAAKQQAATSEMLRSISNARLQSVLDAVAENAAHLCDASNARIRRLENNLLQLVAGYGEGPATVDGLDGLPVDRDTATGCAAYDRRTIHVHDILAENSAYPMGSSLVRDLGLNWRTTLATPLLRDGVAIGTILIRRNEVRPFSDSQIALLETFADQAAIAIENVRLFEAERQRTHALARSEMHLAAAQRLSQTGSYSLKPSTNERRWSEEVYRIFDLDPATGPNLEEAFERVHPDHRDRIRHLTELQHHGEVSIDEIVRLLLPDGSIKFVHVKSQAIRGSDGELEVVGALSDITKVKVVEDALRENEQRFRDFAETASDWLWETGPDFRFTVLTENAFGSGSVDRVGKACWDYALDLETEPEKWSDIRAKLDAQEPFRDFVYCAAGGNGSPMFVRASGKPVFDGDGRFRGYRGTGTDVTAVVRAQRAEESLRTVQAELAHVSRITTLGQLTASIAHEITQPIATARNNARAALNFLERQPPELGEIKEALGCILGDTDRAGKIIDRIRDQIKKTPPRKERFDLVEAINEVVVLAHSAIAENDVSIRINPSKEALPILGDRVQLQQVLLNLILNAVEAMGSVADGPRDLSVGIELTSVNVVVALGDSGPGIDPKDRERIFQAFYSTKSSGVGIGLAICRSIIEAHGGRLWVDANKPQGAVFRFTLPSAESA